MWEVAAQRGGLGHPGVSLYRGSFRERFVFVCIGRSETETAVPMRNKSS